MKDKSVKATSDWFESGAAVTDDILDPRHPLQSYIQQNCFHHARDFSSEEAKTTGIYDTLIRFFSENGPQHSLREYRVFCTLVVLRRRGAYSRMYHAVLPRTNSIFGVIALGLHNTLYRWWNKDLDIPSLLNERGQDLLMIAATFGHEEACRYLINKGCDVNRQSNYGDLSVLRTSIDKGMFDIASLLLDNGAMPDCIERDHSHLCFSTEKGPTYVQLLLDKRANPNIMCNDGRRPGLRCRYGCALSKAAQNGDIVTLQALIEKGAAVNPEITEDDFGSPLAAAVSSRKLDCARFLVEKGANVNANLRSGIYGSPLSAAMGKLDCTRFLVDTGAKINVDLVNGQYGSALAAAVSSGSLDCVRFLVQQGAEIDAYLEFGNYGSALAAAVLAHGKKSRDSSVSYRRTTRRSYYDASVSASNYYNRRCICYCEGYFCKVADYLMQEHHIDPYLFVIMGFEPDDIEGRENPWRIGDPRGRGDPWGRGDSWGLRRFW